MLKTNTFFCFKNRKLVAVVTTTMDEFEDAVGCDYFVKNPEGAEKQIEEWKNSKSEGS